MISIIFGILAIFIGIMMLKNPMHGRLFSNTEQDYSSYQPIISFLLILFGLLFILKSIKSQKALSKKNDKICPKCEIAFPNFSNQDACTECGSELEALKGFYEKQPIN